MLCLWFTSIIVSPLEHVSSRLLLCPTAVSNERDPAFNTFVQCTQVFELFVFTSLKKCLHKDTKYSFTVWALVYVLLQIFCLILFPKLILRKGFCSVCKTDLQYLPASE